MIDSAYDRKMDTHTGRNSLARTLIALRRRAHLNQAELAARMGVHLNTVNRMEQHPERKWRFDFAFPEQKIALEVEGGLFTNGGHSRGAAYERNLEKYNAAAKMGWRVLRYSTGMVIAGTAIDDILVAIREATCE